MASDLAYAPVKCYLHNWYGSVGMHCPLCQEARDPPVRLTDVIEPPPEWLVPQKGVRVVESDVTYELGNGAYARIDSPHGAIIYNDDNVISLSARQTEALKRALESSTAMTPIEYADASAEVRSIYDDEGKPFMVPQKGLDHE